MKTIDDLNFKYIVREPSGKNPPQGFSQDTAAVVKSFHQKLPGYKPTDLVRLNQLAKSWKAGDIFVKDESTRFDLKAFKVLGGSYAVARLMCKKLGLDIEQIGYDYLVSDQVRQQIGQITFTTATDGNHGRGIAWAAQQLGQQAVIYMPKGAARSRIENIRSHGAKVEVTDLNYDDAVRLCCENAEKNGWYVVQDTAWEGYTEIPLWIMQGYITMCSEAIEQMASMDTQPTHVFVQAGVGALAGAIVGYLANKFRDNSPRFIVMEPARAACILASAGSSDNTPQPVGGDHETIMAGLACGEPNIIAWDILRDFSCCYLSCEDYVAANGMRILANPLEGDKAVESGESGAIGIGLLDLLVNNDRLEPLRRQLKIDSDSKLLFFNTEGATDPENWQNIVWYGKYPSL
ncbi:MAG: diaminopropionate ammonia-lyase [Desulfobacteraceae bacterium]|nr:diaminopropionate ammonia-lyase [Desulfobacteraceae bacterium]